MPTRTSIAGLNVSATRFGASSEKKRPIATPSGPPTRIANPVATSDPMMNGAAPN